MFLELLQIVMFSLYGNQYGEREEHLLLKMFEVTINRFIVLQLIQGRI